MTWQPKKRWWILALVLVGAAVLVVLTVTLGPSLGTLVGNRAAPASPTADDKLAAVKQAESTSAAASQQVRAELSKDTSLNRIEAARQKGALDEKTAQLNSLRAVAAPSSLPAELRGKEQATADSLGSDPLQSLVSYFSINLSSYPAMERTEVTKLFSSLGIGISLEGFLRPVIPGEQTYGTSHFLLHFAPSYPSAQQAGDDLEQAFSGLGANGFPQPRSDGACTVHGPDARIDVYFTDTSPWGGWTTPCKRFVPPGFAGAFILIDKNNIAELPLGLALAHELAHASQFETSMYNLLPLRIATWVEESTAAFMSTVLIAKDQQQADQERQEVEKELAKYYFASRDLSLAHPATSGVPDNVTYARYFFWRYLFDKNPGQTLQQIKNLWKTPALYGDVQQEFGGPVGLRSTLQTLAQFDAYTGTFRDFISAGYKDGSTYPLLLPAGDSVDLASTPLPASNVLPSNDSYGGMAMLRVFNDEYPSSYDQITINLRVNSDLHQYVVRGESIRQKGVGRPAAYYENFVQDPTNPRSFMATITMDQPEGQPIFVQAYAISTGFVSGVRATVSYTVDGTKKCKKPPVGNFTAGDSAAGAGLDQCPIGGTTGTIKETHNASCDYKGVCGQVNPPPQQGTYSEGSRLACAPLYENYGTQQQIRRDYFEQHHLEGGLPVPNTENCSHFLWFFVYDDTNKNGQPNGCGNDYDPPCTPPATGDPRLSGVTVRIQSLSDPTKYLEVKTNGAGEYQTGDLPPDKYEVTALPDSAHQATSRSSYQVDTTKPYGVAIILLLAPK